MTSRLPWRSAGLIALALRRRIDLRRMILGDLPLKAAAFAVAAALFVWATAVYNAPPPTVVRAFDGRIPVLRPEVPAGFVLRGDLGDVAVRLSGPEEAVRAVTQQQLRATLDLSTLVPGPARQDAPVRATVAAPRVAVVDVSPATVPVSFERVASRTLAVQAKLANAPPAGFVAAPATFQPQQVSVSGPESAVSRVAGVLATVLFGDAPVDLAQDVRPVAVDADGVPVGDVEVDPVAVHVSIPVRSSATTRTVPIQWQLRGDVAQGFWLSRVATEPLVVTVSGPRSVIEGLDQLNTVPIDVSGLSAAKTVTVPLVLPEGTSVLGESRATITLTVVALTGTRSFSIGVRPLGAEPGLAVAVAPRSVDVVVAGTMAALAGLAPEAVTATVDVTGLGPGAYVLDVATAAPTGLTVRSVQPVRVTVTLSSTATPTPAPTTR